MRKQLALITLISMFFLSCEKEEGNNNSDNDSCNVTKVKNETYQLESGELVKTLWDRMYSPDSLDNELITGSHRSKYYSAYVAGEKDTSLFEVINDDNGRMYKVFHYQSNNNYSPARIGCNGVSKYYYNDLNQVEWSTFFGDCEDTSSSYGYIKKYEYDEQGRIISRSLYREMNDSAEVYEIDTYTYICN